MATINHAVETWIGVSTPPQLQVLRIGIIICIIAGFAFLQKENPYRSLETAIDTYQQSTFKPTILRLVDEVYRHRTKDDTPNDLLGKLLPIVLNHPLQTRKLTLHRNTI